MPVSRDTIDTIRRANGAESTLGSPPTGDSSGTSPYGFTLVGAINQLERIAENMDEYGLAFADLSAEKQAEFERAHEAFQWHIARLSNVFAGDVVGNDGAIELPNGNTIDLPKQALSGSSSANLPSDPGNA